MPHRKSLMMLFCSLYIQSNGIVRKRCGKIEEIAALVAFAASVMQTMVSSTFCCMSLRIFRYTNNIGIHTNKSFGGCYMSYERKLNSWGGSLTSITRTMLIWRGWKAWNCIALTPSITDGIRKSLPEGVC